MLPYSPLHHLLLEDFGGALVATSGNISGEPVLTEPAEAQARLAPVADGFLHHDRPIARPADDPVVRMVARRVRPVRPGRGTAPLEITLPARVGVPTLAVGAYMKTTVALAWDDRAVVSPHIGDLASPRAREVFAEVAHDLQQLYGVRAERIAHDAHPGFANTRWARESGLPTRAVWHHWAHASAVAGEYPNEAPMLCFTLGWRRPRPGRHLVGRGGPFGAARRLGARRQLAPIPPARRRACGARALANGARLELGERVVVARGRGTARSATRRGARRAAACRLGARPECALNHFGRPSVRCRRRAAGRMLEGELRGRSADAFGDSLR